MSMAQSSRSAGTAVAPTVTPRMERVETMFTPGAVMSGWYSGSPSMPRDENPARMPPRPSAHWAAELVGSGVTVLHAAATEITQGAALYGLSVLAPGPE